MVEEFKNFILRGNVIDLAVGVIIGGAFNKIVTSLVNDLIMPLLSLIIGNESLDGKFIALDGNKYASVAEAANAPLLKYGSFIATVLDFLLMGFIIFLLVKLLSMVKKKFTAEKPAATGEPTEKECPFCISQINIKATVCPNCTSRLEAA